MKEEKRLSPLMICMLVVMIVLAVMSMVNVVMKLTSLGAEAETEKAISSYAHGWFHLMNVVALGSGIIYLLKGYSKKASGFYKAFLLLTALANASFAVLVIVTRKSESFGFYDLWLPSIIMGIEVLVLLILSFWKDLGRMKTWTLFGIMMVADVVFGILYFGAIESVAVICIVAFTKLILDATIAMAIYAKYADKAARGTK